MPVDPRTWAVKDFVTAGRLNGNLYAVKAQAFAPTGIRFHAAKPVYKATQAAGGQVIAAGNWRGVFQGMNGPAGNEANVLVDSAGLYGAQMDPDFTGTISDTLAYSDGKTAAGGNGGWYLCSVLIPMSAQAGGSYQAGIASGWNGGNPAGLTSGTIQAGNAAHDTCCMAVDLIDTGNSGLFPVAFNGGSSQASLRNTPDSSGETLRWQAHWACVLAGDGFTAASAPAPQPLWTSATALAQSAFLNGSTGIRDVLRVLNMPPAFRVTTSTGTSCPNQADTLIKLGSVQLDTYGGWSGFTTSTWTVPFTGLYLCYGMVPFPPGAVQAKAGININGTTYWGPAAPAPSGTDIGVAKLQIFDLHAGDTVQLRGWQSSGSSSPTATDYLPRMVILWLGSLGVPATPALPAPPDISYRWAAGLPPDLSPALNAHLANDLCFLVNRPYLLAYQASSQNIPQSNDTILHTGQVQGIIHGGTGDNYGGYSTSNWAYTAQAPGWYLATGEVFFPPANLTATPATLAEFQVTPSTNAVTAWDWYQHQNMTTGNNPGGAAAIGLYYLRAGDTIAFGCQTQDTSSGAFATSTGAGAQPHFELVWLSELEETRRMCPPVIHSVSLDESSYAAGQKMSAAIVYSACCLGPFAASATDNNGTLWAVAFDDHATQATVTATAASSGVLTVTVADSGTGEATTVSVQYTVTSNALPPVGTSLGAVPWNDPSVTGFLQAVPWPGLNMQHLFGTGGNSSRFTTWSASDMVGYPAANRIALIDLQPSSTAQLSTFLASCQAAGQQMFITMWHAPLNYFATPAAYFAQLETYVPIIHAHGYQHVWDMTSGSIWNSGNIGAGILNKWAPIPLNGCSQNWADVFGLEYYCFSYESPGLQPTRDVRTLQAVFSFCDPLGIPVALTEWGVRQEKSTEAQGDAFWGYCVNDNEAAGPPGVFNTRIQQGLAPPFICFWNKNINGNTFTANTMPASYVNEYLETYALMQSAG